MEADLESLQLTKCKFKEDREGSSVSRQIYNRFLADQFKYFWISSIVRRLMESTLSIVARSLSIEPGTFFSALAAAIVALMADAVATRCCSIANCL